MGSLCSTEGEGSMRGKRPAEHGGKKANNAKRAKKSKGAASKYGPWRRVTGVEGTSDRWEAPGVQGWEPLDAESDVRKFMVNHASARGLANEVVVKATGTLAGVQFTIEECTGCEIWLNDFTSTVSMDKCKDCKVYIGGCESSSSFVTAKSAPSSPLWASCGCGIARASS